MFSIAGLFASILFNIFACMSMSDFGLSFCSLVLWMSDLGLIF